VLEYAAKGILLGLQRVRIARKELSLLSSKERNLYQVFDPAWYRDSNPDLPEQFATLSHYLSGGWAEFRSPHPLFSMEYYFRSRPDVRRAGIEPLGHFIKHGWKEGTNPHPLFDVAFYLSQSPSLNGLDPLTHYATIGSCQGLRINNKTDYKLDLYEHSSATNGTLNLPAFDAKLNFPLISVESPMVRILMTDFGGAFGIYGYVHSTHTRLKSANLSLIQRESYCRPRDVLLQTGIIDPRLAGTLEPGLARGLDGGFYISASFTDNPKLEDGLAYIEATLKWTDNRETTLRLCSVQLERVKQTVGNISNDQSGLVGIAMATYNPDPLLFERQVNSIRAQSYSNWFCVISDDGSDPTYMWQMLRLIGEDKRFAIRKNAVRVGFYRNFERALASLPTRCAYFAFSDQDDVWKPSKLSEQVAQFSSSLSVKCVYTDMEIISTTGETLSKTFFVHRDRVYGSLTGLLFANTITGMTILFKSELREPALPFPATPTLTYHDHWVALLAESTCSLKYISHPLVEYVQHGGNHTGALTPPQRTRGALRRIWKRTMKILSILRSMESQVETAREVLSEALPWIDLEACKLRILAANVLSRRRGEEPSSPMAKMGRVTEHFHVYDTLIAGVSWGDRYRRAYTTEVLSGRVLKSLIRACIHSPMSHLKY
jgi:Glycosyl transferase family 2